MYTIYENILSFRTWLSIIAPLFASLFDIRKRYSVHEENKKMSICNLRKFSCKLTFFYLCYLVFYESKHDQMISRIAALRDYLPDSLI